MPESSMPDFSRGTEDVATPTSTRELGYLSPRVELAGRFPTAM
jgi:hypothetical protein